MQDEERVQWARPGQSLLAKYPPPASSAHHLPLEAGQSRPATARSSLAACHDGAASPRHMRLPCATAEKRATPAGHGGQRSSPPSLSACTNRAHVLAQQELPHKHDGRVKLKILVFLFGVAMA